MPKWLRKSIVVLVTVLTFGLVTPPPSFLAEGIDNGAQKRNTLKSEVQPEITSDEQLQIQHEIPSEKEQLIRQLVNAAESQSYVKFGNRIKPVIQDEFKEIILPNIEKTIEMVATQYEDENLHHLVISEQPTGGRSEKIFHIADAEKNQDIIRFHVRKDHPPQEGYWFNFHYHTYHDGFQAHHELGSIYWARNTPPKWMS